MLARIKGLKNGKDAEYRRIQHLFKTIKYISTPRALFSHFQRLLLPFALSALSPSIYEVTKPFIKELLLLTRQNLR